MIFGAYPKGKEAKENNLVEYNDEYINFNNVIVIYTVKENYWGELLWQKRKSGTWSRPPRTSWEP